MKVHLLGNTCNGQYFLAKALRKLGVDAHLFYNSALDIQTHPESQDPEVKFQRPDWLHPYTPADVGPHPWADLHPRLMSQIADCDIIQAEDVGVVWAMQSGRPYIWYPYGFDIHFYPFHSYWRQHWSLSNPEHYFAPVMFRRAIASSSAFVNGLWVKELTECYGLVKELLGEDRFLTTIPVGTDTVRFSPGDGPSAQELLDALGISYKIRGMVIFHPTRMMFTPNSYCQKGNDRLLQACKLLKNFEREFSLVLVTKGNPDEEVARRMIEELGIAENVVWVPMMTHAQLVPWYRASDVTVDEFVTGAMGSISAETMACGTAQLTYLATEYPDPTYWPPTQLFSSLPPVLNSRSVDEIFSALLYYSYRPRELKELGAKSRVWVEENMSGPVLGKKWQDMYEGILAGTKGRILSLKDRAGINLRREKFNRELTGHINNASQLLEKQALGPAFDELIAALDLNPEDPNLNIAMLNFLTCNGNGPFARVISELALEYFAPSQALAQFHAEMKNLIPNPLAA